MRLLLLLTIFLLFPIKQSEADPSRSDWWLSVCGDQEIYCAIYIQGALEGKWLIDEMAGIVRDQMLESDGSNVKEMATAKVVSDRAFQSLEGCPSSDVTISQRSNVWLSYLEKNPARHHEPPIVTYAEAMREAFICN